MESLIVEMSEDLQTLYAARANYSTDSGFDLYMPSALTLEPNSTTMIDLGLRCELRSPKGAVVHGYYLYPRSSISKTPLRLANSVGIIDAEYRGTLKVAVDNRSNAPYNLSRGDRLFQICMPSLVPFEVVFDTVNMNTERGEGGFGSTGGHQAGGAKPPLPASPIPPVGGHQVPAEPAPASPAPPV